MQPPPPRPRRALTNVDGPISLHGPAALARPLADILERVATFDADSLTHGFHAWPARMHRALAGGLVELLLPRPGGRVLDPFAGGGTVPIEAMLRGHQVVAVDANPLSPMLVRVKTRRTTPDDREAFGVLVEHLVERSLVRVRERTPAKADLDGKHLVLYGTHTLKELAGLLEEIRALESMDVDPADIEAALMLFSALVVKVSNKVADTSEEEVRKRIRKGLATELFQRKAQELVHRWAALEGELPRTRHRGPRREESPVRAMLGDARRLDVAVGNERFDLVLTSPPYGGTYDYADQHALRLDWLGLDARGFDRVEIGSRRHTGSVERWDYELGSALESMRRVLRGPEARVVLVLGDAQIGPERVDAHAQVVAIAPHVGLAPVAAASQLRPDFQGGPPRHEHVIVLRPR